MFGHHFTFYDFLNKVIDFFPLREKGIYSLILAFLPTIIAISYPIIIQTITKLNELYSSTLIIDSFKKEKYHILFKNFLIASLVLSGLTFLNYETINVIAFIFIIFLIVFFIKYIELILIYNNPNELHEHILNKSKINNINLNNENINKTEYKYKNITTKYHEIICDLYCYSIKLSDYTLETNIREKYFYKISYIGKYIDNFKSNETTFDSVIFNSNFRIIENYIKYECKQTRYKHIEFFSTEYYLPITFNSKSLSPFDSQTFSAIWNTLLLLVNAKNYKKLKAHWEKVHQYYFSYLKRSFLEYDQDSNITKESID